MSKIKKSEKKNLSNSYTISRISPIDIRMNLFRCNENLLNILDKYRYVLSVEENGQVQEAKKISAIARNFIAIDSFTKKL